MPVLPQAPAGNPVPPGPTTFRQICTNALIEINVIAPDEVPSSAELLYTFDKANQLADHWTAQQVYIYANDLISVDPNGVLYLLHPALSPHTIGPAAIGSAPSPTFLINNERPVRIISANVLLSNVNPIVRFPLAIRDKDWWSKQRVQTIQTSLPTDLYYRPDWPLGSLFFWPVPNFAYQVEFEIETIVQGGVNLDTVYAMPPGYELAMILTLAELICPAFEKGNPNPLLIRNASAARNAVKGLNNAAPRINLDDFGPPGVSKPRASFNYHTGLDR